KQLVRKLRCESPTKYSTPSGRTAAKSISAFGMLAQPTSNVLSSPLKVICPLNDRSYSRFSCRYRMSPPTLKACRAVVCDRLSIHWKVLPAVRLGWSIAPPRLLTAELPETNPPANANCGIFPRLHGALRVQPVF